MKKRIASLVMVATTVVAVATMVNIVHSSKMAETVPPSPNFIKVTSTVPTDPNFIKVASTAPSDLNFIAIPKLWS